MKPKPKRYKQFAFAVFDKSGIVPFSGALAVFEEKDDAEYQKQFYLTFGKAKVKPVLIMVRDD